jgi:hypothetical protein
MAAWVTDVMVAFPLVTDVGWHRRVARPLVVAHAAVQPTRRD